MRNTTTTFFFILTAGLFAMNFSAYAQQPTTAAQGARRAEPLGGAPAAKPVAWVCLESPKYNPLTDTPAGVRPGGKNKLLMKASGSGFPTDTCVYVVGCINTENNIECTTGDSSLDRNADLNLTDAKTGEANATRLRRQYRYTFIVDGGSKKCNLADGKVEAIVHSESGPETIHTIWGVYPTTLDTTVNQQSGDARTLKLGTFGFEGGPGSCVGQRWDPYGIVFDSQSLEPLPQTSVTLLDSVGAKIILAGLQNPIITKLDGLFNFLPEPGEFKLSVSRGNYIFSAFPNIHANYTKAYSELYKPEDVIVEKAGQEQHRDIPLDPGSQTPYRAEPAHMSYGVTQTGQTLRVSGKQTHPLTVVTFLQNGAEIAKVTADKFGYYGNTFENALISADAFIQVFFTKTDLTAATFGQPVKAYETAPIPPYLEGRAKDASGTVLGGARVKIKLEMNGKVYAEKTADEAGVFSFEPRDIPPLTYYLEYTPTRGPIVKKTVPDFAAENKDYLTQNNIDLMTATKNGQSLLSITSAREASPTPQVIEAGSQTQSRTGLIAALILLLILLVGAGFIYTKRLRSSEQAASPNETPSA